MGVELLHRSSRDGWTWPETAKNICDKGPLLILIKSKQYGNIFGGVTFEGMTVSKSGYYQDNKAFLFSLTHKHKLELF